MLGLGDAWNMCGHFPDIQNALQYTCTSPTLWLH